MTLIEQILQERAEMPEKDRPVSWLGDCGLCTYQCKGHRPASGCPFYEELEEK